MDLGMKGKTALVTGGGRGIGRAIALALAAEGVHVAIASRDPEPETICEIEALGVRAERFCVDVSREKEVVGLVQSTIDAFGHLDMFVSNAGHHWHEPVTKITTTNLMNTINTNLASCIWGCREVARHMIARGQGSMLIVASTIQFNPGYKESSYRVSKVGLKAYAETLALELAPLGIRVNVLSPGIFPTKLAANLKATMADPVLGPALLADIPIGRLGMCEECGPAAAVLLSDKVSSYITGADLVIDGGFKLRPLRLVSREEVAHMNR
ncbi:MAG: SDR family oxidoreductase [Chloroflexi bacterium]|nr:SDR family oxidoreductase [Chloroflexota bacterium]